jgi:formate/nitrite transporter FocA (FNT family)
MASPTDGAAATTAYPSEGARATAKASGDEPEHPSGSGSVNEQEVEDTLERTFEEGRRRLNRGWAPLVATGLVGGIDVGTGVMAMLVVEDLTGNKLLAGLAFSVGFIALTMARSELFTEDFLVPVGTVIAKQATVRSLARLWWVTAVSNLVGGWVFTLLIVTGLTSMVRKPAIEAGAYYVGLGIGWRSFALALLGGAVITLMTWMQHATESLGTKIVPAVTTGFLLAGLGLNHAIVASLLIFAGLHTHATSYGYLNWAATAGWATLGNIIGGIALVTLLRMLQVPNKVRATQDDPAPEVGAAGGD